MNRLNDLINSPVITEKSANINEKYGQYTLYTAVNATKKEIKEAVKEFFNVKVLRVRTMLVKGKVKKFRRHIGKRNLRKKAILFFAKGENLKIGV